MPRPSIVRPRPGAMARWRRWPWAVSAAVGVVAPVVPGRARGSLVACILVATAVLSGQPLPPSTAEEARVLVPESFGATGDGRADDTDALQRALEAMHPGDTLSIRSGRTYRHHAVLSVRTPGVRLVGSGTLLATDESRSALLLDADRVTVDGLTLRIAGTSRRWDAFEQMKLRLSGHTGITVRDVTIDGAAAAGVYVGTGASDFLLQDLRVQNTRADGVHITGAAHDGVVRRVLVERSGDDGVAVVSYQSDNRPVRRVLIDSPTVRTTTWGRGVSVVGGEDVTYRDVQVQGSDAAAVYVAAEGPPYNTFSAHRIRVEGGTLEHSNTNRSLDHGAILVYSGEPGLELTDITVDDVVVRGTRDGAPFQVGVVAEAGAGVDGLRLSDLDLRGGGDVFWSNVPSRGYRRTGWVVDGVAVPDQVR